MTGSVKSLSVAAVLIRSMPAPNASVGTKVLTTWLGVESTRRVWVKEGEVSTARMAMRDASLAGPPRTLRLSNKYMKPHSLHDFLRNDQCRLEAATRER